LPNFTYEGIPAQQHRNYRSGVDGFATYEQENEIRVPLNPVPFSPEPRRWHPNGATPGKSKRGTFGFELKIVGSSQFHRQLSPRRDAPGPSSNLTTFQRASRLNPSRGAQLSSVGGIQLIPASRLRWFCLHLLNADSRILLADIYRALFPFGVFNAVQSACFSQVIEGDENMVICAPTGSGKTVLFELAMIRFLEMNCDDDSRCIYIAPTKASCKASRTNSTDEQNILSGALLGEVQGLVSKVSKHWDQMYVHDAILPIKLTTQPPLIPGCEMTGDTESYGKGAWAEARGAKIMSVLECLLLLVTKHRAV
jgi:hypothetical protein